jgi:Family of unknown function (DUF6308)
VEQDIATPGLDALVAAYFDPCGGFAGATFDELGANPLNEISSDDLFAVTLLDVAWSPAAVRRLLGPDSKPAGDLLAGICPATDLWQASPNIMAAVDDLWELLVKGRDGVGQTRASKLLARKRPRLVPLTDSVIVKRIGALGETWPALRYCLEDGQVRSAIERLRPKDAETSVLRLLDVAIWMLHSQSRSARKARADIGLSYLG